MNDYQLQRFVFWLAFGCGCALFMLAYLLIDV